MADDSRDRFELAPIERRWLGHVDYAALHDRADHVEALRIWHGVAFGRRHLPRVLAEHERTRAAWQAAYPPSTAQTLR
jgi:hypothetical protein